MLTERLFSTGEIDLNVAEGPRSGPTLVLLALGMLNPAVIVLVGGVVAMEKLTPKPQLIVRLSGVIAVIVGLIMIGRLTLFA